MRDCKGKTPKPIKPTKPFGIYGAEELLFEFDKRPQAEKFLTMLQAPPDGSARTAAMKFTIGKTS